MEFIDDIRFVSLNELHIGPKIEDMITFLSSSPEMAKRQHTSRVIKLCCLRLGHVVPKLPSVTLGFPSNNAAEAALSDIIEPLQNYLLSSTAQQNISTSAESISSCVELLDESETRQFNNVMTLGLVWISMTSLRYMLISLRHIRM